MSRLLIILSLIISASALAQTDTTKNPLVLGLHGHGGLLFKHSSALGVLKKSYPWGLTMDIAWHLTGIKAYQYCSCYPKVGVSVNYFNFDNPTVLGNAYYAIAFVEPVFFLPRKFNLSFRLGLIGVAFHDKPFDADSNPTNVAYSTYAAFPLMLGLGFNYRVTPQWSIKLAANYNHISNGGIKNPNKGLNFPTASIGVDYMLKYSQMDARGRMRRPPPEKKNKMVFETGNGLKNSRSDDPDQYWVFNLNLTYSRWFHRSSAVAAGFAWEMDNARRMEIVRWQNGSVDHNRLSFFVGHEFWLGKVRFGQYIGAYVYDHYKVNDPVYHRHSLTFNITKFLYAGVSLKAHRQVADVLDLRIGTNLDW
jgi:opacity protein-like surface antigen